MNTLQASAPPALLGRYRDAIEQHLQALLDRRQGGLYDMLWYHFGWMDANGQPAPHMLGKALRPALCLLACEAVGSSWERALPAASAIELVHNFSLIHDDIQDNDQLRHDRPTVWSVWGKAQAINAGDAALALSNVALMQLSEQGYPAEVLLHVGKLLNTAELRLIQGQYLDLAFEQRSAVRVEDYLQMVSYKTAALIEVAIHIGVLLGQGGPSRADHLRKYGHAVGVAFQIRDDLLGIWGEGTGKVSLADLRRGKKTLPVLYLLEEVSPRERQRVELLFQHDLSHQVGEEEVARIVSVLEQSHAQDKTRDTLAQYCSHALEQLEQTSLLPAARSHFVDVVEWLANTGSPWAESASGFSPA